MQKVYDLNLVMRSCTTAIIFFKYFSDVNECQSSKCKNMLKLASK